MLLVTLSNLCWTQSRPKYSQEIFSRLLVESGVFGAGVFLQPPMVKAARAFQFSRSPGLEVVSRATDFGQDLTVLQPVLTLADGYPAQATHKAGIEVSRQLMNDYLKGRPYVLWINSITHFQAMLAEQLIPGARFRVFDSSDMLVMYQRSGRDYAKQANMLLSACEVAVCSSEQTLAAIQHPAKILVSLCGGEAPPKTLDQLNLPPLFPKVAGKIYIGLTGMLTDGRLDFDLLYAVLKRFPEYQFVFAGSTRLPSVLARLKSFPNFHVISDSQKTSYQALIPEFDVVIVPELENLYSRSSDSAMISEYLRCGATVLSANRRHRETFGEALHIATSVWEFSYLLEKLVDETMKRPMLREGASSPNAAHSDWKFGGVPLSNFLAHVMR